MMPLRTFLAGVIVFSLLIAVPVSRGSDCSGALKYYQQANRLADAPRDLIHKVQLFRKIIEICPREAGSHYALGDVYRKQGRKEEADREFAKAGELAKKAGGSGVRGKYMVIAKADIYQGYDTPHLTRSDSDSPIKVAPGSSSGEAEPLLSMETGIFYYSDAGKTIRTLKENDHLPSGTVNYFIYFKPLQDCYVYLLAESQKGASRLLFPTESAFVEKDSVNWLPGRNKSYTLSGNDKGEALYLLVTSWQLDSPVEGVSLQEVVSEAVKGLMAVPTRVVGPSAPTGPIKAEAFTGNPKEVAVYMKKIEGKTGWVKAMKLTAE